MFCYDSQQQIRSNPIRYGKLLERWRDLESCTIARGFALTYRVAAQVIKSKGSNKFLHEDSFHSGVRRDFFDTDKGIRRKHIVVEA
jgi:hypothetical protein